MILFLGTRPGRTSTRRLASSHCSHCGLSGTLSLQETPNYFHLFWLPIFKIGTLRIVECSHCKRAYYSEEFSEEVKREINS